MHDDWKMEDLDENLTLFERMVRDLDCIEYDRLIKIMRNPTINMWSRRW